MGPGNDVNTTLSLVLSIVAMACCGCVPLGVGGLIFSIQAGNAKKVGDMATAQSKNKTATLLAIVGMVGGVIIWSVVGVLEVMAANQ